MKLKYVDELSGGRKRFRKRYPKAAAEVLGEGVFQVAMRARSGADLVNEHERLMQEYDKIVARARRTAAEQGQLSPLEHWREAVKEAEALVASVQSVCSEDEARALVAEDIQRRGDDPVLYLAVISPDAEEPKVTLADAKEMYRVERLKGATGRNQQNRLDRVCKRIETSLGPLNKLALVDLRREHARKLRDDMVVTKKADGSVLSPATVRRELDMIRAIVSLAITEHDLQGKANNPFDGLEVAGRKDAAPNLEWENRDPLPKDVILAMRQTLKDSVREPALPLIWSH